MKPMFVYLAWDDNADVIILLQKVVQLFNTGNAVIRPDGDSYSVIRITDNDTRLSYNVGSIEEGIKLSNELLQGKPDIQLRHTHNPCIVYLGDPDKLKDIPFDCMVYLHLDGVESDAFVELLHRLDLPSQNYISLQLQQKLNVWLDVVHNNEHGDEVCSHVVTTNKSNRVPDFYVNQSLRVINSETLINRVVADVYLVKCLNGIRHYGLECHLDNRTRDTVVESISTSIKTIGIQYNSTIDKIVGKTHTAPLDEILTTTLPDVFTHDAVYRACNSKEFVDVVVAVEELLLDMTGRVQEIEDPVVCASTLNRIEMVAIELAYPNVIHEVSRFKP